MQTLQQIEQFKEQAHQTQDFSLKQNLLIQALELAIADQIEEECTSLYVEIAQFDPKDPFVCYQTSLLLKKKNNSGLNQLFLAFLETQAQSDADFQLHHSFINASVLGNDKGFDMKLRDLSKNASKIVDWQAYRFIDQGKWRNVQQIFADRIGGDPNQARASAAKEVALLSQKLKADQNQQADFWKQVYQTNKDDIDAQQALIKLYKDLGKFKEYVDVYRKYVEALDEYQSEEKIEALKAIIAVYEFR